MISSYRLGDLVILNNLTQNEEMNILNDFPNSIGSKYILEKRKNNVVQLKQKNLYKERGF